MNLMGKRALALLCAVCMLSTPAFAAGPPDSNGESDSQMMETHPFGADGEAASDELDADTVSPAEGENEDAPNQDEKGTEDNASGSENLMESDEPGVSEPESGNPSGDGNIPDNTEQDEKGQSSAKDEDEIALYAESQGRTITSLNEGWKYSEDDEDASAKDFSDSSWETVNLPHTWNAEDGADGGSYRRGVSWYRKTIQLMDDDLENMLFLEFLGANSAAEVFVNGKSAGEHKGGYTTFRCPISEHAKKGDNTIAVKVSNEADPSIAPLGGDFTFFGGIYRNVSLISVAPVHIDLMDNGSSGVFLTPEYDEDSDVWTLGIRVELKNETNQDQKVKVKAAIHAPEEFESIDTIEEPAFDPDDMTSAEDTGEIWESNDITVAANDTDEWEEEKAFSNPHLWAGIEDPFRYQVDIEVISGENVIDSCTQYIGFRYFTVDREEGFFLNGESYPLRGVSRHQDGYDAAGETYLANALTTAEHDRDFGLIYEMGANYIRLAHYPHDPYFYDLCDRYGIIAWAEIPVVSTIENTENFVDVTKQQLIEMIRQNYNRPSICFWGLTNEISGGKELHEVLNKLAHDEDATRLTTFATNSQQPFTEEWASDVIAVNTYPGWYAEGTIESAVAVYYGLNDDRPIAISEYGAGANIEQHQDPPVFSVAQSRGQWHPEEYQSLWHERALADIKNMDSLWSTAVWNMFDFGSDSRAEGDQKGINDKGLVTIDRKTKKDAFYLYKANWNDRDKFVHLNSSRFTERDERKVPVKAYSNCESVSLTVNHGTPIPGTGQGNGIFTWEDVELTLGQNTLTATGTDRDGSTYTDTIEWNYSLCKEVNLSSADTDKLIADNEGRQIVLKEDLTLLELENLLTGEKGTTWTLYQNDIEITDKSTLVTTDMQIKAISEDRSKTETYTFAIMHLAVDRPVKSDGDGPADHPPAHAVDANSSTYYASGRKYDHMRDDPPYSPWIEVDLGAEYFINEITVQWNNSSGNARGYRYLVKTSTDGQEYETWVDRSSCDDKIEGTKRAKWSDHFDSDHQKAARYIRIADITINGSGADIYTGRAEISEIMVNGWQLSSDTCTICHETKTIYIPESVGKPDSSLMWADFEKQLNIAGTFLESSNTGGSYFVVEGDRWKIKDSDGNEIFYTIHFGEAPSEGEGIRVTGVSLNMSSLNLYTNRGAQTCPLYAAVYPENADNPAIVWSSSDPSVATVDANGVVAAVGVGTATITVSTVDGGFEAHCVVSISHYSSSSGGASHPNRAPASSTGSKPEPKTEPAPAKKTDAAPEPAPVEKTDAAPAPTSHEPSAGFADIEAHWAQSAINYVAKKGMMNGTNGRFNPDVSLSRGMVAQILYNLESGTASSAITFPDVAASDWFADAVSWAASSSIMSGYSNGRFGANDAVSREQLALTLYQYAQMKGIDISQAANLDAFPDGDKTSNWAKQAVQWAVANKLLSGKSGGILDPQGTATRAEAASILMRFFETVVK